MGPDGTWSPVHSAENSSKFINGQRASSDEDDLVEIQEPRRLTAIRAGVISTPSSMTRTPPQSSREQSIVSATARSSGGKRPHAVIDLTLSSDDEEQPRAPKRPNLQASLAYPNSFGSQGTPASGSSLRHNSQNFGFSVHGSSGSSSSDHLFGR